ncbi:MAG: MlaD family protein [Vicinamibacteria bacterium]|nr:MlaD family protein [Vicinamibacteria bacterium]
MENRAHALAAGLFTLCLAAGLVGTVIWLSQRHREAHLPYILVSRSSVAGLNPQAAVRYRGVDVGRVSAIRFDPEDARVILIDVGIAPNIPVTTKSFARLGFQGVTGLAFVDLDEAPEKGTPLATNTMHPARIEMRPSALQEFGDAGQLLLVRVNEIALRLNALLNEENQTKLSRSLAGLERAIERVVVLQERLMPAVESLPRISDDTHAFLKESQQLVREMSDLARDLRKQAEVLDQVGHGANQMGSAAADLSTQTLPALNRLLGRLTQTTESLERAIDAQTHDPRSLLFGSSPPEPGPGESGFKAHPDRRTP